MPELVTIDEAKAHLRLTGSEEDLDLTAKLTVATDLVVAHVTQRDDGEWADEVAAWDADTVPTPVKHAVLVQFAELYRVRGDDDQTVGENDAALSPLVRRLLSPYRDPTLA